MSGKSEVERAAEVMYAHCGTKKPNETWSDFHGRAAKYLSAAGLLRTDADRLYAELAEAMVAYASKLASQDDSTDCQSRIALSTDGPLRTRVWAALRAILDARKPKQSPLDEVLSLWRECKCKVPGPLSDALDRLERERAK